MVSAANNLNLFQGNIETVPPSSWKWTWILDHYAFWHTKKAEKRYKNGQYKIGILKRFGVRLG